MAESIPKAKSAYAFFQAAMNKQMVGVPLGESPASIDTVAAPPFKISQRAPADRGPAAAETLN